MDIEEIKKRLAIASEGPWQRDGELGCDSVRDAEGNELFYVSGFPYDGTGEDRNVEFLLHAREDISDLLSALDKAVGYLHAYLGAEERFSILGNDVTNAAAN